jgi:hypothetical protein
MESLFHQKYHRHNHYTKNVSADIYPDAGLDPIASHSEPFQGDFVLDGSVYSQNAVFKSQNIGIKLESQNYCLSTDGNVHFDKVTSIVNITATQTQTLTADYLVASDKRCFTQFNKFDYNLRTWEKVNEIDSIKNNIKPVLLERVDKEYYNSVGDYLGSSVEYNIDGTRPLDFTWYKIVRKTPIITEFITTKFKKEYPINGFTDNNANNYIVIYDLKGIQKELQPNKDYTIISEKTLNPRISLDLSLVVSAVDVRVISLQEYIHTLLPYKNNFLITDKSYTINIKAVSEVRSIKHNLNNKDVIVYVVDKFNKNVSSEKYFIENKSLNDLQIRFAESYELLNLDVSVFIQHPINVGEYTTVISNNFGTLTCSVFIPFDEDNIVNHRDFDIITHNDELIGVDYVYLDVTDDIETETSLLISNRDFNYILV